MRSFVKIKPSRIGDITLSFTDMGKSCPVREFVYVVNVSFNAIREYKILAKISEFTVPAHGTARKRPRSCRHQEHLQKLSNLIIFVFDELWQSALFSIIVFIQYSIPTKGE